MSEVEIKSVSRLSDQVEAKIARANRAFKLSSRIIAAARDDLNGHGEWLDRHRLTWAAEVKRHRRLLHRKLTMRTLMRSVVGLLFAAPFAFARALERKGNGVASRVSRGPRRDEPATESPQAPRQRTIRGLDGPLCTMEPVSSRPAPREIERRQGPSPLETTAAAPALAGQKREPGAKRPFSALGLIALCLIGAGAVRATLSSPTGEAPALAAKEVRPLPPSKTARHPSPPGLAASLTVPKTPRPPKLPAAISGSAVLATPSHYEPLQMPPRTVADIAVISRPQPVASPEAEPEPELVEKPVASQEPEPAPVATRPVAATPAVKTQPKRKLARRQPEPLPWWQQWSWIRLR